MYMSPNGGGQGKEQNEWKRYKDQEGKRRIRCSGGGKEDYLVEMRKWEWGPSRRFEVWRKKWKSWGKSPGTGTVQPGPRLRTKVRSGDGQCHACPCFLLFLRLFDLTIEMCKDLYSNQVMKMSGDGGVLLAMEP